MEGKWVEKVVMYVMTWSKFFHLRCLYKVRVHLKRHHKSSGDQSTVWTSEGSKGIKGMDYNSGFPISYTLEVG